MSRKLYDVRIYPGLTEGFDVLFRVHGGIVKHGSFPTLALALDAARSVEGRRPTDPVYVFDHSFARMLADAMAPALECIHAVKGAV